MSTNILCDGIHGTLNSMLQNFTNKLGSAGELFELMSQSAQGIHTPGISTLNSGINQLGNMFNMVNNGLSLGKLGDMATCLGLAGVGFNLNGTLSTIPDWLGQYLNKWVDSAVTNILGGALSSLIKMGNSLSNLIPVGDIDKLLGLYGCLEGNCSSSYLQSLPYTSSWQLEQALGDVGLNLDGNVDYNAATGGLWEDDITSKLGTLTTSYGTTQSLILSAQGYDPILYNDAMSVINNNSYN